MSAHRNGGQGIVHAKFPRHTDLHIHLAKPRSMIGNTKAAWRVHQPDIVRPQPGVLPVFSNAVSLYAASMPFDHIHSVRIVDIDNPCLTLTKQHPFAGKVFLKGSMFIRADMVWLQIGKNSNVKYKPADTVHFKPLGGNFHHARITARVDHPAKILLHEVRFRRRICRRDF